jgi:hypothetical protein
LAQETPDFLTAQELAARYGKSIHTILWWRREDRGPKPTRVHAKLCLYRMQDVLQFEEESGVRPVEQEPPT